MREISCEAITSAVRNLCISANCLLPEDVRNAICQACDREPSPVGRSVLSTLKENYLLAEQTSLPICQDTGLAVVFMDLGQDVHIVGGNLSEAVNAGVRAGYLDGYLRCSVVRDPFRRENTGDNTPAVLHLRVVPGDQISITVAPKGFGSENMSVLKMFRPSVSIDEVESFIVSSVETAGSNPCPPIVVGIGFGGTAEYAALLAKRALLLPVNEHSSDPFYAEMETRLLEKINCLGVGPQGLGGRTTALSVRILSAPTHIAGLPCAINIGCHVTRHSNIIL